MTKDLTTGKPGRLILLFALPVIAGNLFQQCYSLVDLLIVGRTLGVDALAAVGATGSLTFFIISFVQGITTGFSVLIGQRFGAKDKAGMRKSVASSIVLCIGFTVFLTALSSSLALPMLQWMGTPENILQDTHSYLLAIYLGTGATVFYNMIANVIRSLGDSHTPLIFLIIASVLNIILDYVFIVYFFMGVAGAAWATVISQLVSALLCLIYVIFRFPILYLKKEDFRLSWQELRQHLRLGVPMGFQMSIMSIGLIAVQATLNPLGSDAIAAFTSANKVDQLALQISLAFSTTAAAFVAQNYGAGQYSRIRVGVRNCVLMAIGLTLATGAVVLSFSDQIIQLFLDVPKPNVIEMGTFYLSILVPSLPMMSVLVVCRSSLQSMGYPLYPFMACIIELGMRILAAIVFAHFWGYTGLCFATPSAWAGGALFLGLNYLGIARKLPADRLLTEKQPV